MLHRLIRLEELLAPAAHRPRAGEIGARRLHGGAAGSCEDDDGSESEHGEALPEEPGILDRVRAAGEPKQRPAPCERRAARGRWRAVERLLRTAPGIAPSHAADSSTELG